MCDWLIYIGLTLIGFGLLQNIKMQWASPKFLDWSSWITIYYWKWGVHWDEWKRELRDKEYPFTDSLGGFVDYLNKFLYFLYVTSMTLGLCCMFVGISLKIIFVGCGAY